MRREGQGELWEGDLPEGHRPLVMLAHVVTRVGVDDQEGIYEKTRL